MENIQGYAIKNTMDNTGVEQGMKGLKRQMGVLSSEVKANMTSFGKAEKSVQKYQTRIDGLNNKMKVQKRMYDQTKNDLNNVKSAYEKASNSIKQQEQKVKELAEAHKKQDDAMRKSNQEMKKSNKELDNAKAKQSVLSAEKAKAKTKLDDLRSAEKRLKESGKASTEQIKQASNATKQQREVHQKLIASHKEETANVKMLTQSNKGITEENKKVKASYQQSNNAVKTAEKEYNKLSKTIKDYPKDLAKAEKAVNNEKASMNGLQKSIDKAEQELKQFNKAQTIANSSYTKHAKQLDTMSDRYGKMAGSAKSAGRNMTMYLTTPIAGAFGGATKAAIDYEQALAGVQKTTDFSSSELNKMSDEISKMSKEMPFAQTEIAGVGEAAGQLGVKKSEITDFTKTMLDMSVATNLSSEEAATEFARFANAAGMPIEDVDKLGSAVVNLGNTTATTEKEIVEMGQRLAGAGAQAGFSGDQIMSISAAMSSVGIEAESGGTAMTQIFNNMTKATADGGETLENFAKTAGMSGEEFASVWEKNPTKALSAFVEGLSNTEGGAKGVLKALDNVGIKGIREADTIRRLSNNHEVLDKALKTGSEGWKENNALTNEAKTRYKTMGSQLKIFKNQVVDLGIDIGNTIAPAVVAATKTIGGFVEGFEKLPKPVKAVGIGLGVVAAATGPLVLGFGMVAGAISKATKGYAQLNRRMAENSAEAAINAGANKANAGAIATSGKSAKGSAGLFGRFGKSAGKANGKLSLLGESSKFLGGSVMTLGKGVLRFATGPLGIALGAITLLGTGFKIAYDKIGWFKDGVDGIGEFIKAFTSGTIEQVQKLGGWFSKTGSQVKESFFDEMKKGYKDLDDDDLLKKAGDGFKKFMETAGKASDKATDTTKVLGKGVSKETEKALDKYVKYSEDTTRVLSDIKLNHGKITNKMRNQLETSVQKGGEEALKQVKKRNEKVSDELNDMLKNSEAFTAQEKQDMIQKNQEASDEKVKKLQDLNREIEELELKQFNDGKLTAQEEKDLKAKLDERTRITTESLVKGQKEQQVILSRMNSNTGAIDTQQASDAIKDAVKAEKKAKKEAKKQRDNDIGQADDLLAFNAIDQKEHDKRVKEAEKTYDKIIDTIDGKTKDIRKSVQKNNKDIEDDMDMSTGKVYSNAEKQWNKFTGDMSDAFSEMGKNYNKFKENMSDVGSSISSFFTDTDWKQLINDSLGNIGEWIATPFKAAGESIGSAVSSWQENISEAGEDIKGGFDSLTGWFSEQGQEFWGALRDGWNTALENGGNLWNSLTCWLGEKWEDTKTWFSQKGHSIWSNIKIGWNNGLETGGNLWSSLTNWLGEKWEETKTWFSQKGGHIWSNIKSGWNNALETGGNLWSSITNKLGESWENTKSWFSEKGRNIQQSFKNGWNSAWDTAGNIWGKVTKGVSDTWENVKTSTRDKLEEAKETATTKTRVIWKNTSKWFGDTYNTAKDKVTGVYTKTRDKFTDAAGKVWDKSKSAYDGTKKWFGETYEKAKTKVTGVYNQAKGKFTDTASTAWDKSKSTWKGTSKYFGQAYGSVKTNVSNMWGKAKTSFGNIAGEGWKKAKSVYKGFKKWLGDTLQWIKDVGADMGKAAGDLGKKVANKAIGGLNGMIGGVNKISKAITGKDKLIEEIPRLATGTYDGSTLSTDSNGGLRQPTVAMVNDKGPGNGPGGRTQELIQRKDGSIDAPQGKNTVVGLGKGDGVINARHTHKLQEQGIIPKRLSTGTGTKIPRFSKGNKKDLYEDIIDGAANISKNVSGKISDGYHSAKKAGSDAKDIVEDLGSKGLGKVKDGASWLGDKIGDVWDYVKHPGKLVNKVMDSIGINFGGGDNATVNLVKAAYKNLKTSLVDKVKDWFTEAEGGDGDASWLLKHPVLQTFGNYTDGLMFNGGKHYGMDFGMPTGTKIKALTDGKISQAGAVAGGGGNQITLDEPGGKWYQWYMHMSKIIAKKGQKVSAGDVIGLSGSTGNSTTPHLHIQRMKGYPSNETAVNPKKWLESLKGGGSQNKSAQKWSGDIKKAAKRMGVSLSGTDLKDVISLINTESNGNAGVTQQVQDQNSGGNEAQGLLQYTPGTFGSYAVKGHKNIKNGYDQLLAFFNNKSWRGNLSAWKSRMASGLTGWGPTGARKYENGGISTTHKLAEISERNRAEAIIPLHKSKRNRAVGLMEKAMTAIGMDNGSANVTVNNDNSTMEKLLQQVVQLSDTNNRMQQTIIKLLSGNNNNISKNDVMNIFSQLLGSKANLDNFNQGF
ncbi:phage tail tape measure protein [Staphylococcus xylosus]